MHYTSKPKRRRKRGAVAVVLGLALLLSALGGMSWLAWTLATGTVNRDTPCATAPEGTIKGLLLRTGPSDTFAHNETEETRKAYLDQVASYAKTNGFNAIFVQAKPGEADNTSAVFYRDRAYKTLSYIAAQDSFFHKFDALRYLCEAADTNGIAVYAYFDKAESADQALQSSVAQLMKKYPVADVYWMDEADGAFAQMTSAVMESPALRATADAAWSDPGTLFLASLEDGFAGAVLDDYDKTLLMPDTASILASALHTRAPRPTLLAYTPDGTLAIGYPQDGATLYSQSCFIMGTSDPALPLLMNGENVQRTTQGGTFGILVNLSIGVNSFTFTQQNASVTVNITRGTYTKPEKKPEEEENKDDDDKTPIKQPHDDTVAASEGQAFVVNGWIASLLYDPSHDGNINETVRRGAIATVKNSVETQRNGVLTFAYQLESGDYILAKNVTLLGDTPRANFTGAAACATAAGETLSFTGSGTPLAYTNMVDGKLVMHFYNADAAADFAVTGSNMVSGVTVAPFDGGVEIAFSFYEPLWGHTVEYTDGVTQVLLNKRPVRSVQFGKPLVGTKVLLDAGHGADDTGAMGAAGAGAPTEKDVNLAVALAAKYRLEQMGAVVEMVRTDDTFLTLEERNRLIIETQPDFFVAVHHNSIALTSDANQAEGTECYYFYSAGKELAQRLVTRVVEATDRKDRGAMWGYYYVTRSTVCPAVLLETGFMVNPAEYENVTDNAQIWAAGDAIARSILDCVPKN